MLALWLAALAQGQPPALDPHLQPLAFLVGSCWRASLLDGRATDTRCYTSMLAGRFVRERHSLSGVGYSGESIFRWDPAARQIRSAYYSSEGVHLGATLTGTESGLTIEAGYPLPQGVTARARATWTRDGPDAFVVASEIGEGDGWRPAGTVRFERVSAAPPD